MGNDNGDVCNNVPPLGIMYFKSFYFIFSFYSHFVNFFCDIIFIHGYIFSYAQDIF
jgi:hypothetical protein